MEGPTPVAVALAFACHEVFIARQALYFTDLPHNTLKSRSLIQVERESLSPMGLVAFRSWNRKEALRSKIG